MVEKCIASIPADSIARTAASRKSRISFFILLLLVLTACTTFQTGVQTRVPIAPAETPFPLAVPTPFIGDGGMITGQPCALPCFFGIHIGGTSLEQVILILEDNGISSYSQDEEPKILCRNRIVVGVNKSTFIVDSIGYYPNITITVEEIILKHGAPDAIQVIPTSIPEAPKTAILLMFDELRMRIIPPEIDGREYFISGSTEIESVNYFDETLYAETNDSTFSQS